MVWSAFCIHYVSITAIYLLIFFWYKLHDQMLYEKPYSILPIPFTCNIYLLYLYKCKCAKFLSSLYSMDCFILLASFCQFEIWSSPYISLSTLFALICYHWSRKWQSRYIEHLIIHTRLVWMYSIKINRFFFKKEKKIYLSMSSTILLFIHVNNLKIWNSRPVCPPISSSLILSTITAVKQ